MKSEAQTSVISGQLEVQQRAARTQATIPTRPVRPLAVSTAIHIFMQTRPSIKITISNYHHPHHCNALCAHRVTSDELSDCVEWVQCSGANKLILINNKSGMREYTKICPHTLNLIFSFVIQFWHFLHHRT